MYNKGGACHTVHLAQIIELLSHEATEEANFTFSDIPY